jgi:hypothetical protein
MFQKALFARLGTQTSDQPKAPSFWGLRRRVAADPAAPAPADETTFVADAISAGFEVFGRCGLELDGLHRDHQWVGSWGGRC